jgi:Uri superfamily endonuclease
MPDRFDSPTAPVGDIPSLGGSYALGLILNSRRTIPIGRLGIFDFPAGYYIYLGSAHGAGGLRARISHHQRLAVNPRWHLDYLRACTVVDGIWYQVGAVGLECVWSKSAQGRYLRGCIAAGFGASDCQNGCLTHLWWIGQTQSRFIEFLLEQGEKGVFLRA